ncbi:MAG: hypothetical protein J6Y48_08135 [Clostridia bacterium]|nr:hypothetical protein [Clostridia bacterium]
MAGPYNKLGNLMRNLEQKGKKKKASKLGQKYTPAHISESNEREYIVENGLDREDAALYRNDREGFRRKVNDMVRQNEATGMKNGMVYTNYGLVRAAQRGENKKKGNKK